MYLCLCLDLFQLCHFYKVFLKARGACAQQGSICEAPRDHKCIEWQYVVERTMFLGQKLICFTFTRVF